MDINHHYLVNETEQVNGLLALAELDHQAMYAVENHARHLVGDVRAHPERLSALDRFLGEYNLAHSDGVVLMCLAESLLRIPDSATADALIADKLSGPDWAQHLGSDDLLVNASTWGLMLTGQLLLSVDQRSTSAGSVFKRLAARLGEPLVRNATRHAMRIIGDQFVMAPTIEGALIRSRREAREYETFSYDMLGEAAMTTADAERYCAAYLAAIDVIGKHRQPGSIANAPGISVKLSALCPRFEFTQRIRAVSEIGERLAVLAARAAEHDIQLTVDAEETDRLEMTLSIFAGVVRKSALRDWDGLGIAVQAYQKRAVDVIHWLRESTEQARRRVRVRLVKGAYWDNEIKLAQTRGLSDYPVFTRKCNTDVAYLACARTLLGAEDRLLPQFATHNAHTIAWVTHLAADRPVEFQRLHGMGEGLYAALNGQRAKPYQCRVYAPVGAHEVLLPYLVRRLLENGANSSFVHRIADRKVAVEQLIADPVAAARSITDRRHPLIPRPRDLYGGGRRGARGFNFADKTTCDTLLHRIGNRPCENYVACPIVGGVEQTGKSYAVLAPADPGRCLGQVLYAQPDTVVRALELSCTAWESWDATRADRRANILENAASAIENDGEEILLLIVHETGRTFIDAYAEIREAIDFLRYYAGECRRLFGGKTTLAGPAGETNHLSLHGRGVIATISPWNFPVSIFVGQIAAALAAGNTVIAKPAEQSALVAARICAEFYRAGVPGEVLHFLPGHGPEIGAQILADPRLAGVAFTGSSKVAGLIAQQLAAKPQPPPLFVAETGGINCMIADSSALPEQIVVDVVSSAFNSAGQRCSALRVLYLQSDIAQQVLTMLRGHMRELVIGDPMALSTDIGPVIDETAAATLHNYIAAARAAGRLDFALTPPAQLPGHYVGPCLITIGHISEIPGEVFGPILHIRTFDIGALDAVCDEINSTGYGLTLGIHSRVDSRVDNIVQRIRVGNIYVNRNMIGAMVESQPFGGIGLSGTGPKAGGPNYLLRFATERTLTVNTAAVGGNATLISLTEDPTAVP